MNPRLKYTSVSLRLYINDLWEAGIKDDNLALIFKANEFVNVGVKTPFGMTERRGVEKSLHHYAAVSK